MVKFTTLVYSNENKSQIQNFVPGTVHDCKKCNYIATTFFSISNHTRRHNIKPLAHFDCTKSTLEKYFCKDCKYKTNEVVEFRNHIKNHNVKPKSEADYFYCDKCVHKTRSIYGLTRHKAVVHTTGFGDVTWYNCDQCVYRSKIKYNLKTHIQRVHTETKTRYPCDQCKLDFKNPIYLTKHKVLKHPDHQVYKCAKCTYATLKEDAFKKHQCQDKLKKKDPVTCYNCGYTAPTKARLVYHMRIHSPNVTYLHCNFCSFKTRYKKNLGIHYVFKHSNSDTVDVTWYKCELCSYKAKSRGNLKQHMLGSHTSPEDLEWFHCDKCDYKAIFKNRLISHMMRHVESKEYRCSYCPFQAKKMFYVKRHYKRKHNDQMMVVKNEISVE